MNVHWPSVKVHLVAISLIMVQEGVASRRYHFISSVSLGVSGFGDIYGFDTVGQLQACPLC